MTEDEKITLKTMHDLACRQLGPLLAQSGSEGGDKIAAQLYMMGQLVSKLTGSQPPATEATNGSNKPAPPESGKKKPFPRVVEAPKADNE